MITCRHCGAVKPPESFPPDRDKRNGFSSWCRLCHREVVRAWRATHRDHYNALERRYYAEAKARPLTRTCRWCGGPFEPNRRGRPRQYCSLGCRTQAEKERRILPGLRAIVADLEAKPRKGRAVRTQLAELRERIRRVS